MKSTALQVFNFSAARFRDYMELTKPRLVSLVLLSAAVGFFLAEPADFHPWLLAHMLLGTLLVAAGSMTLNQWMERHEDAKMIRTSHRPLPAGRLLPAEALIFGVLLSAAGLFILSLLQSPAPCLLAAITLFSYLLLYTPLKRKTSLCTIVGALPGALPVLIGWTAAAGRPSFQGWVLFFILFLWQMPHFLAIAWLYRHEYANAGFSMLSVTDPDGRQVGRQIVLYSLALLPVSLLPAMVGMTGMFYFFSAFILGIVLAGLAVKGVSQLDQKARPLFRASVLYLAALLILMVLDKR